MTCGREIGYTCSDNPGLTDPGCGEHFASLEAFDRHLLGAKRVCLRARQMLARGFRRNSKGAWSVRPVMGTAQQTSFGLRRGRPRKPQKKSSSRRSRTQGSKASKGPRGTSSFDLRPTGEAE